MAEREELIQRSLSGDKQQKGYGAVSSSKDEEEDDIRRPVRCVCTKRDCVLVTVLSILIVASIVTSLVIGIPNIKNKQSIAIAKTNQNKVESPIVNNLPPLSTQANIQKRAIPVSNNSPCNGLGACAQ